MPQHTDRQFSQDLHDLKEFILKMGSSVESMIALSIKALIKKDSNLAKEIILQDKEVNQLEIDIDTLCLKILALHQPAANDLRFVAIGMKISTDLERMGDLAVNICREVIQLNQNKPIKPYIDLPLMAQKSQAMVHDALQSFMEKDADKAKRVREADDEIDALENKIYQDIIQVIQSNPEGIPAGIHLITIARQLERIGDHSTNVAEEVSFLVKGEDVRHGHGESA